MECVASTLHTTSEYGISSITTVDAHNSAASSRLNWRPRLFKWTRSFRWKTRSCFCACAITFQTQSTYCYRKMNTLILLKWRSQFESRFQFYNSSILRQYLLRLILWYFIFFTHLLTAIVLTPGGSSTVHIYTQTTHRTTQLTTRTTQITTLLKGQLISSAERWTE